jgi:hypothetical protein
MLFVRIINNEVKQVWDTQPPAGESGWKSAIEVRPAIIPNRQYYTGHTFDLSKDPVEIVYGVEDISVEGRKDALKNLAKSEFQKVVQEETRKQTDEYPETQYDAAVVEAARLAFEARFAQIDAVTTHDELDAL